MNRNCGCELCNSNRSTLGPTGENAHVEGHLTIAKGLKRYFTGNPCKHGHISERFLSGGECIECAVIYKDRPTSRAREGLRSRNYIYKHSTPKWADKKLMAEFHLERIWRNNIAKQAGWKMVI